jgi:hypothetical protein
VFARDPGVRKNAVLFALRVRFVVRFVVETEAASCLLASESHDL